MISSVYNPPMSKSMVSVLILFMCAISSIRCASSSSSLAMCPHQSTLFFNTLRSQSPLSYSPILPFEVDGDFLDRALNSKVGNTYTSILFYASWCPFSHNTRSTFEVLSSMYPQIKHLAVEQSSVVPSVLSRYGIHSLPTILMINQTSKMRFYGAKDLHSLAKFYRRTTGLEPVPYLSLKQPISSGSSGKFVMQSWVGSSPKEMLRREPHLVASVFFLCVVGFIYAFPTVLLRFKAFWVSYGPHLNLGIFGETSQMLGRVLQMVDVNRIWTKLKCKASNFQRGAKNSRVWASSLASVSLGKTSSCRSTSS